MVRCTFNRKTHGKFEGNDQRGKHVPANTFRCYNSTYQATYRKFFCHGEPLQKKGYKTPVSISRIIYRKMYDLYKIQCEEKGISPASAITYRRIFCNRFTISFHKPKKDTCQQCNAYAEKKKANFLDNEERTQQRFHLDLKEKGREEKEADTCKAKEDKSILLPLLILRLC